VPDLPRFLWCLALGLLIEIGLATGCAGLDHWFLAPVLFCGAVIGLDAGDWISGRLALFDPIGVVGMLGFHFFFLAPLLHVVWDSWMRIPPPPDWRDWLGAMAVLNGLGLLVYRHSRERGPRGRAPAARARTGAGPGGVAPCWRLDAPRFLLLLVPTLALTAALQLAVYARFGGVAGYIGAYESLESEASFQGMGWLFMISESFPILMMMGYAVAVRHRRPGVAELAVVLLTFLALKLFFGGLRGSRSNTVWGLLWAIGIIHFRIRHVPRSAIVAGLVPLVLFLYVYGLYKSGGRDGVATLGDAGARAELEGRSGRTVETALLGDLGRSDVQAYLLYRLCDRESDYEYGWGASYLAAITQVVPRSLWPNRPEGKRDLGTRAQYGAANRQLTRDGYSTRIYGLAGEAMLNFGPAVIPLSFLVLGWTVRSVRAAMAALAPDDARWLVAPFAVNLCFLTLTFDFDLIVFIIIKNFTVPGLLVYASSDRRPPGEVP
jgi:hypothetical protein